MNVAATKWRVRCRHQMEAVVSDLILRKAQVGQAVSMSRLDLRPDINMPLDADEDLLDALSVGDELEALTGPVGDPGIAADHLFYVARHTRRTVKGVLRCWRLWIAYRLGLLDGITQLGPAEMVAQIRNVEGEVYQEWREPRENGTSDTGVVGHTFAMLGMELGGVRHD